MITTANKTVSEIMSRQVLVAHPNHEFLPLCRLFLLMNIHHLPVVDAEGNLIGMLSANDVLKALSFKLPTLTKVDEQTLNRQFSVLELMTPQPIQTISPEDSIATAARIFASRNINCLPVTEQDKVVGVVTSRDIVKWVSTEE